MSKINNILKFFSHTPTNEQNVLFTLLDVFLNSKQEKPTFILKGYAGTGKTSIVSALVNILHNYNYHSKLLAPTGRAAKVLSNYSKQKATTIHRFIYKPHINKKTGQLFFKLKRNYLSNTLFIVDESSMIAHSKDFETKDLLKDFIEFVFSKEDNKLMFVGDTAQLPPVLQEESRALNKIFLEMNYSLNVHEFELVQVLRQELKSGILHNATLVREKINSVNGNPLLLNTNGFKDIYRMTNEKLMDGLNYGYKKFGIEDTLLITRSNKTANRMNQFIRNQILFLEEEIAAGDYFMVVKNNYFWLESDNEIEFIANGDVCKIKRILKFEEKHGFRFADIEFEFTDIDNSPVIEAKVILNTLFSNDPALNMEESRKLYDEVLKEYDYAENPRQQKELLLNDKYYNALQIKFAYAITCHKAQGGQWKIVFVEPGYLFNNTPDKEYYRWLYTALTRAREELYLVNFDDSFF